MALPLATAHLRHEVAFFKKLNRRVILLGRKTRPACTPGPRAAAATAPTFATHNRPQPAANDLDILQSELAKFDLRSENADITHRSRRNHKPADGITKTAEGGIRPDPFFKYPLQQKRNKISASDVNHLISWRITNHLIFWRITNFLIFGLCSKN